MVFQRANVHPRLDDRAVGPHIGATQVGNPDNLDIFLLGHAIRRAVNRAVRVRDATGILAEPRRGARQRRLGA